MVLFNIPIFDTVQTLLVVASGPRRMWILASDGLHLEVIQACKWNPQAKFKQKLWLCFLSYKEILESDITMLLLTRLTQSTAGHRSIVKRALV